MAIALDMVAVTGKEISNLEILSTTSITPISIGTQELMGILLGTSAIFVFLVSAFLNFFRGHNKSIIWKVKENLTLALVTSSVYLETEEIVNNLYQKKIISSKKSIFDRKFMESLYCITVIVQCILSNILCSKPVFL